ncbi:MAG: epoxyqueuosine reductase QueH, partial [Clostridia bacterium]|nr:epoxyqueuosine reductase QueH [Clostridia bacterium]
MNMNYQLELDRTLKTLEEQGERPTLLLHSCCGPCSSYVLDYLSDYFDITVLYYNPCIDPEEEYELRKGVQKGLIQR